MKNSGKLKEYAEIMHMFRYYPKDVWVPESMFANKSRRWLKAFNNLIEKGIIKRRKKYPGQEYRWAAEWPY